MIMGVFLFAFPIVVLAAGWYFGWYWVMIDGGTCEKHPVLWFSSALEALEFIGHA